MSNSILLNTLKKGEPLDGIPVIDFHTHMGSSSRFYYVPYSTPEKVIPYFKRYGIDHAITFALSVTTDASLKNKNIYKWHENYPDFFSTLTTLHANFPQDWMDMLREGEEKNTVGIKLLSDYQGVDECSVDWSPVFDIANKNKWIILHHDWREEERLGYYAKNFPQASFIIGHPTMKLKKGKNILTELANVYQCTCAAFVTPGFSLYSIEDLYNLLPTEKILFGSDALDLDIGTGIGSILYSNIPEKSKAAILGRNALPLLKRIGVQSYKHIECTYNSL